MSRHVLPPELIRTRSNSSSESSYIKEAQQLALEASGLLLPPQSLCQKISIELSMIREKFPTVSDILSRRSFIPGELICDGCHSDQIADIASSEFGPLKDIEKIDFGEFSCTTLLFNQPYNPNVLAKLLKDKIPSVQNIKFAPNKICGDGDTVNYDSHKSIYTFKKGWGDCQGQGGCLYNHFWEFFVSQTGDVKLNKEYGTPLNKFRAGVLSSTPPK